MSVTISNSISLDGFICGPNGEEEWISSADEKYFSSECEKADFILMGSGTFDSNPGYFPFPGGKNVVFTKSAVGRESVEGITFTDQDPISFIREHEGKNILVAGGGKLNATLLKSNVATDIITCIHPIILGAGTRQFEGINHTAETKLIKVSEEDIEDDVVLIHYKVS